MSVSSQTHAKAALDGGICLRLNGREAAVRAANLAALLCELDVPQGAVAVELNGKIISPAVFAATPLTSGDVVELVRFVGGG